MRAAEVQFASGLGVPNEDARAQVLNLEVSLSLIQIKFNYPA